MVCDSGALTASSTLLGCQTPGLVKRQPPTKWPLSLDGHFVSPVPAPFPGSAGLQPGSRSHRSHARAWRSQGKPGSTGSGSMKQTASPAHRHSWHDVLAYQLRYLAHPTDIAIAISQDKPDQNILRWLRVAKQMRLLTIVLPGGNSDAMAAHTAVDHLLVAPAEEGNLRRPSIGASRARQGTTHPAPLPASAPA